MEYHTIFDGSIAPPISISFISIFFIALIFLFWVSKTGDKIAVVGTIIGVFVIAFACYAVTTSSYKYYYHIQKIISANEFKVVEGTVRDFKVYNYRYENHDDFCVATVCFEYYGFLLVPTLPLHNEGSPICNGLPVRVTYIDDDDINHVDEKILNGIIKLEIGQDIGHENKN